MNIFLEKKNLNKSRRILPHVTAIIDNHHQIVASWKQSPEKIDYYYHFSKEKILEIPGFVSCREELVSGQNAVAEQFVLGV